MYSSAPVRAGLGGFAVALAIACESSSIVGDTANSVVVPATLTIGLENGAAINSITMNHQTSLQLVARVHDAKGNAITGLASSFASTQPAVVSVDSTGLVTGMRPGTSVIAARVASRGVTLTDSLNVTVTCTSVFRFGLFVQLADSVADAPLAVAAKIVIREGAFGDSILAIPPGQSWLAAGERPGTYQLTIRAAGYRDWVRDAIVVGHDGCHVVLVSIRARLQR
jgi:hypothetical protein